MKNLDVKHDAFGSVPEDTDHPVEKMAKEISASVIVSPTQTLGEVFGTRKQLVEFLGRMTMATHEDPLDGVPDAQMLDVAEKTTLGELMEKFNKEKARLSLRDAA